LRFEIIFSLRFLLLLIASKPNYVSLCLIGQLPHAWFLIANSCRCPNNEPYQWGYLAACIRSRHYAPVMKYPSRTPSIPQGPISEIQLSSLLKEICLIRDTSFVEGPWIEGNILSPDKDEQSGDYCWSVNCPGGEE